MARVVFRHAIRRDLQVIETHISEWAPQRAIGFVEALRDKCQALAQMPERGQLMPNVGENIRRLVHGNYLILYRYQQEADKVIVLRIIEGHRELRDVDFGS